ncbi:hypothetical protein MPTK1_2g04350 [Marchantia polymorpha subsp. ruderalis]|uniref:Uncharacterized protein n=1 Tax=Marchantia polymorpha TaxID=3197 RepID=A0A2R6X7P9_MARPO|nr:hypothetical protein MARPO_0031s0091 [Marchantia polymorpha]BBN01071.1 hypothetical protein Mp_2g04350 [Marchantia polymorpha subsp. ruderalis]|eukprot:PTQ42121.1 hypothetical protein MARPO_0031s0091 [Marchantia polymorpha]
MEARGGSINHFKYHRNQDFLHTNLRTVVEADTTIFSLVRGYATYRVLPSSELLMIFVEMCPYCSVAGKPEVELFIAVSRSFECMQTAFGAS